MLSELPIGARIGSDMAGPSLGRILRSNGRPGGLPGLCSLVCCPVFSLHGTPDDTSICACWTLPMSPGASLWVSPGLSPRFYLPQMRPSLILNHSGFIWPTAKYCVSISAWDDNTSLDYEGVRKPPPARGTKITKSEGQTRIIKN